MFSWVQARIEGKLVEWVEKVSFDRLNRLFEIAEDEKSCETLLSAQNLRLVTQEPQPYVINILPRWLPKKVVAGEHFVLKDLPFYTEVQKADAQARKTLSTNGRKEGKKELCRRPLVINASRPFLLLAPQRERRRRFPQREL